MDNLNIPVSREGLQDLIKKRRLFSFLFLLSVALAAGIFYVAEKHYHYENIGILIMTLLVTPFIFFAFLSKYNDALINTTYHLIARNLHWKAHKLGKKYKALYDLYQHSLQKFGLLQQDGYLEFHSELEGEIENYKFTLQDISLTEMVRGKGGKHPSTVAEYALISTEITPPADCNILIRKNKIVKWWGIQNLSRIPIKYPEFEKYYDVYTDNPEKAFNILNLEFFNSLLNYKKQYKKQIQVLITPQRVFLYQDTGLILKLFNFNFLLPTVRQCQKMLEKINTQINMLTVLDSLNEK